MGVFVGVLVDVGVAVGVGVSVGVLVGVGVSVGVLVGVGVFVGVGVSVGGIFDEAQVCPPASWAMSELERATVKMQTSSKIALITPPKPWRLVPSSTTG